MYTIQTREYPADPWQETAENFDSREDAENFIRIEVGAPYARVITLAPVTLIWTITINGDPVKAIGEEYNACMLSNQTLAHRDQAALYPITQFALDVIFSFLYECKACPGEFRTFTDPDKNHYVVQCIEAC